MASVIGDVLHVRVRAGQAGDAAQGVAEIEIAVAVAAVGPVNEAAAVPLEEPNGVEGLGIAAVVFAQYGPEEASVAGAVHIHIHVLLLPVHHLYDDLAAVRSPGYVGQIALVAEVVHLAADRAAGGQVIDQQADMLGGHSGHRVAYLAQFARTAAYVQQREEAHRPFVLAVEGYAAGIGTPEYASVYAELVAADRLAIYYARLFAAGDAYRVPAGPEHKAAVLAPGPFGLRSLADGIPSGEAWVEFPAENRLLHSEHLSVGGVGRAYGNRPCPGGYACKQARYD